MVPRLGKVLRISRWEVFRSAGGLDRRSLAFAVASFLIVAAVVPFAIGGGGGIYDGLYVVGVDKDSPYYDAVERSDSLRAEPASWSAFTSGELDVLITERIHVADTQKGEAALSELRDAVRSHNAAALAKKNESAAFPVSAVVRYVDRSEETPDNGTAGGAGGGSSGNGSSEGGGDGGGNGDGSAGDGGGGDGGGGDGSDQAGGPAVGEGGGGGGLLPSGGFGSLFGQGGRAGTPSNITPPFPFESLILAFAFLVPLNFVAQAYSTSVMNERIGRRGVLTLASPVSRYEIIAGKTLPYFTAAIGITAGVAVAVGGSALSVVAVAPVALAFLSLTFVGSMFARSYKELTFVTVFVSVFVTSYVFVPAIFTDVEAIAAISPLSIVVRDLQNVSVSPSWFAFSSAPLLFSSAVMFSLGAGVYREEDMFTQRSVPLKALDAVASWLRRRASVAKVSVILIPFVFAVQLLVLAALFALPVEVSLPVLLVLAAFVEEVAKTISVYAGFANSVFERTKENALVLGALSGVGFFVGEKVTLVAQVVGLERLEIARATLGFGFNVSPAVAVVLFFAPLLLHITVACMGSIGAVYGRREYAIALVGATVVHTTYNLTVVSLVA